MKKILITWICVAIVLVAGLTILGFTITKKNKPYKNLEKKLTEAAEYYAGVYPDILSSNNIKITNEELIDHKYSETLTVNNEKCDGYVVVEKNMGAFNYKAYIKCDNYETKGYKS